MHILIREGTTERSLHVLLLLVTPQIVHLCRFYTDDRQDATLLREGHIDGIVRQAIGWGLDPVLAFQSAADLPDVDPTLFDATCPKRQLLLQWVDTQDRFRHPKTLTSAPVLAGF